MIQLETTDKLQLTTSAAVTVDVLASYVDRDGSTITPDKQVTAITTAATTDILAAPGAGVRRVKFLNIRNKHASTPVDVTVLIDVSATDYELHKVTLQAQEALTFIEGVGWFLYAVSNPAQQYKTLSADQSNSTVTPTEVSGLTLAVAAGTYQFRYNIIYQAAATTTGVRFSVNHDGTVSQFVANARFVDASATAATAAADQDEVLATAAVMAAFAARAISTAGWGTTISVDTANADMLMIIEGTITVTAAGNLELWHGSEVAAASTVKAGSSLVLQRVG